MKDYDRLVAVDGKEVVNCSHEEVVERIRRSGNKCCFLVVDKETEHMYKQVRPTATVKLYRLQLKVQEVSNVCCVPNRRMCLRCSSWRTARTPSLHLVTTRLSKHLPKFGIPHLFPRGKRSSSLNYVSWRRRQLVMASTSTVSRM